MREFNLHQGSQSFHLHSKRSASRWRTLLVNTARFASCVTNETYNGMVPANTKQCNSCALQTFHTCRTKQKGCLAIMCLLIFWHVMMIRLYAITCVFFVLQVWRRDGEPYPPVTIRSLLSGLNINFTVLVLLLLFVVVVFVYLLIEFCMCLHVLASCD